jgi:hypothetical protein
LRGWTNASKAGATGNWRAFRIGREPPSPIHTGQIAHKSEPYPGQDPALIANETWATVRDQRTLQFPREYGSTEQRAARGAGRGGDDLRPVGEPRRSLLYGQH